MAEYDYIVVGSGFGGSVAALRLAQKGYKVLVLEAGRRYRDQDFAKSSWSLAKFLFWPRVGLRGIMRLDFFGGLMVLSGAGVGGGSLVYANTLIEPADAVFAGDTWPRNVGVQRWDEELRAHYAEAKRMLGVTQSPVDFPADRALKATAEKMGFGPTFHPVNVGVYFGEPGVTAKDPYFGGEGPERTGCTRCGGCMVGCREGAKNTLVKNYLYLAEKKGVTVVADTEVRAVRPVAGGYELETARPGVLLSRKKTYRANGVILAAGVLGTLKLLLRCRDEAKTLPALSPTLASEVRTNSESLLGVRVRDGSIDFSEGVAIAAGVNPDARTKIEAVRYPKGSDAIGLLTMPLLEAPTFAGKLWEAAKLFVKGPLTFLSFFNPIGFAKETVILLVMQSVDSKLKFEWRRRAAMLFNRALKPRFAQGRPPVQLPEGNAFAKALAAEVGGEAGGSIGDVLGMSVTAHILGGCPMGPDAATGTIGADHQVHGYPELYVVGGAAVPANLGVNPSLTITAMAERAMARIPAKSTRTQGREAA